MWRKKNIQQVRHVFNDLIRRQHEYRNEDLDMS